MATKIVIDKDALGWEEEHQVDLKNYVNILLVSKHPDLLQRDSDDKIAAYCVLNRCDLITADKEFYMYFFDAGVKTVSVKRLGERGGKYVYLISVIE